MQAVRMFEHREEPADDHIVRLGRLVGFMARQVADGVVPGPLPVVYGVAVSAGIPKGCVPRAWDGTASAARKE